jgi:hypothetical protein
MSTNPGSSIASRAVSVVEITLFFLDVTFFEKGAEETIWT